MNCPGCGNEINDNAKFCKYCGMKMEELNSVTEESAPIEENKEATVICSKCGKEMNANKAFCTNCGTPMNVVSEVVMENKPKRNYAIFILIPLVVIMLFGAVVGGTFLVKNIISTIDSATEKEYDTPKDEEDDNEDDSEENSQLDETENGESSSEVETLVKEIEEVYTAMYLNAEKGTYTKKNIDEGLVAYFDDSDLKVISVSKEYSGTNYDGCYYFAKDELIYSRYEGEISYNFYFDNEKLVRWSKEEKSEDTINYDLEDSTEFVQWESTVQQSANTYRRMCEQTIGVVQEYILPESNTRLITREELEALTKEQVKLARNEIYARHGRKFKDSSIQEYFMQFSWYTPIYEPSEFDEKRLFNSYEAKNRDFISEYEKEKGYK